VFRGKLWGMLRTKEGENLNVFTEEATFLKNFWYYRKINVKMRKIK